MRQRRGLYDPRIQATRLCGTFSASFVRENLVGQTPSDLCDFEGVRKPIVDQGSFRRRDDLGYSTETAQR